MKMVASQEQSNVLQVLGERLLVNWNTKYFWILGVRYHKRHFLEDHTPLNPIWTRFNWRNKCYSFKMIKFYENKYHIFISVHVHFFIKVGSTAVLLRLFLSSSCSCDSSLHSHSLFPLKLTGGQSICLVWVVGGWGGSEDHGWSYDFNNFLLEFSEQSIS